MSDPIETRLVSTSAVRRAAPTSLPWAAWNSGHRRRWSLYGRPARDDSNQDDVPARWACVLSWLGSMPARWPQHRGVLGAEWR